MFKKSIFLLITITTGFTLAAETSVWKVDTGSSTLYLGGTFHLLRKSDFPLPQEFNTAYDDSAALVFETDIGRMNDPAIQQLMTTKGLLKDKSLRDVLSPETHNDLEKLCNSVGVPIDNLQGFKPSIVLLTIAMIELQKLGITEEGVDMHYYLKAKADGKSTAELEAIEEQIEFITSMGEGNEDAFVKHSIKEMETTEDLLPNLIHIWKTGDRSRLKRELIDPMEKDFPELYKTLIGDRNRNWMPQIVRLLKTTETEFVLVGAAHLVGPDGILTTLEKLGYRIEKL